MSRVMSKYPYLWKATCDVEISRGAFQSVLPHWGSFTADVIRRQIEKDPKLLVHLYGMVHSVDTKPDELTNQLAYHSLAMKKSQANLNCAILESIRHSPVTNFDLSIKDLVTEPGNATRIGITT